MSVVNEKALLGCILIDNSIMADVLTTITEDMFEFANTKDVFLTMKRLNDNNEPIDPPSILQYANFNGSNAFLIECLDSTETSANYKSYVRAIFNEYRCSELAKITSHIKCVPGAIDETIAKAIAQLESLNVKESAKAKTLTEIVDAYKGEHFTDKQEKKMYLGFPSIDSYLFGLEKGDLIVIGARPGVGKSAFVTQVITNVAEDGYKVGYFNLEMSEKQIYQRILARYSHISLTRIRRGLNFLGDEKQRFDSANEKMKLGNLVITSGSKKISEIKAESKNKGFDLIVIDYLQLVRADRMFSSRASEVGEISKSIKALAMEMNIPIIALSQMNRVNDDTQEPQINDLRESGDIEQDASVICLMWNKEKESENDKAQIKGFKIGKNRQGESAIIDLVFDGANMEFKEKGGEDSDCPF